MSVKSLELSSVAGNVAYGKIAYQIRGNTSNTAYRAVDGRLRRSYDNEYCALPKGDHWQSAWWYVDLGETYAVSDVIVYNLDEGKYSTWHY